MLTDEIDQMEQKLAVLQKEVDRFTTGINIAIAIREKMWVEMMESNEYLDMQLSLETRMVKYIWSKLKKELTDFNPNC